MSIARLVPVLILVAVCAAIPSDLRSAGSVAATLFSSAHKPSAINSLSDAASNVHEVPLVTVSNMQLTLSTAKNTSGVHNTTHHHVPEFLLPIRVYTPDTDILLGGLCYAACRPSTALQLDDESWRWVAQLASPVNYRLAFHVTNRNIASDIKAFTTIGNVPAASGNIPVDEPADANGYHFGSIKIVPECRKTGVVTIRVTVSDQANVYIPVNFFIKTVCYVEVQPVCEAVNCGINGVCVDGKCNCIEGFFGALCGSSVFDPCPSKCSGNGRDCVKIGEDFHCDCSPGFTGDLCNVSIGCHHLGFCSGHGECINNEACGCTVGWTGISCSIPTGTESTCKSLHHCKGRGKCVQSSSAFVCECHEGFQGPDCGLVKATCPSACSGHGICIETDCKCNFGFTGPDCSQAFSPCNGCMHGACSESIDDATPKCVCHEGFTGPHCSVYDHSTDPCRNASFCSGHGRCPTSDLCKCTSGFGGHNCDVVEQAGCINACGGHGKCDPVTDLCKCVDSWSGADCMTPRCPETGGVLCSGHGACTSQNNGETMVCECAHGFFGTSCRNAYCSNSTCSGHGTCKKSSGVWDSLCKCHDGWTGSLCETAMPATSLVGQKLKATKLSASPATVTAAALDDEEDDFLDTAP